MKNFFVLLLVLIFLLLLISCNYTDEKAAIVGKWELLDGSDTLTFKEDGTLICSNGTAITWGYDWHRDRYYIAYSGERFYFTPEINNNIYSFRIEGDPYFRIDGPSRSNESYK